MAQKTELQNYQDANIRVEQALAQLDTSLRSLNGRMRSMSRIETDVAKLENDRAALASELNRANSKVQKLDKGAADVSRRLVTAMEDVKGVLNDEGNG